MQSTGARVLVVLAAAALVVVAFFVLGGDDEAGEGSSVNDTPAEQSTTQTDAEKPGGGGEGKNAEQPKPKPEISAIVLSDGEPQGGVVELTFDKGDEVRFSVESNVDDEIHVHGYDIEQAIAAGKPTEVSFPAEIDGIFEIESHDFGTEIAKLTINP